MANRKCCGTCKHHSPDGSFPDDWMCVNEASDACGDYTEFYDTCEEWEEREKVKKEMRKSDLEAKIRRIITEAETTDEMLQKVRGIDLEAVINDVKVAKTFAKKALEELKKL